MASAFIAVVALTAAAPVSAAPVAAAAIAAVPFVLLLRVTQGTQPLLSRLRLLRVPLPLPFGVLRFVCCRNSCCCCRCCCCCCCCSACCSSRRPSSDAAPPRLTFFDCLSSKCKINFTNFVSPLVLLAVHLLLGAPLLWLRAPGPLQRVAVCVKGFNIAANDFKTKLGREKKIN